jgi:diguanylate cyclase (GGDEF)-like protein
MKCALREGDTLARIGGDEFVAVMLDLDDTESIAPVLVQLREAASEPVQVGDLGLRVAASIGVTYYPQPGEVDADSLLRQADQAMYQAKLAETATISSIPITTIPYAAGMRMWSAFAGRLRPASSCSTTSPR